MTNQDLPPEFIEKLKRITAKRARTVIDHILEHGQITSEELKDVYGYNHPPRAVRDVREQGIPIETFRTTSSDGRSIAAYRFGDPSDIRDDQLGGRKVFSKEFKERLLEVQGGRCAICNTLYESRYLQIDHRVPYEVAGDADEERDVAEYMLLCTSCNRAKSWSCEQCDNWQSRKDPSICRLCYWANPIDYEHIAMAQERRISLVWQEDEIAEYENIKLAADSSQESIQKYIKKLIQRRRNQK